VQSTATKVIAIKRLLIVVPIYASYRSFLKGLATWLVDRDWEVHVATNLTGANEESDVATLHDIAIPRGANPLKLFQAGRSLTKLIQQIQPTVVHAHFSVGVLCLALANRVKGARRLGTFQGMRFPMATSFSRYFFMLVECFSILRLDKSWVLTADDYMLTPKFVQKKLAVQEGFGFGCEIQHFNIARFNDADRHYIRQQLGIQKSDIVFIFVGRLTAFKGFDLSLEAFLKLRSSRPDVKFIVLGEPDPIHPIDIQNICSIAGVNYLGWCHDPAPYLGISDAMVFPSEREGMPVCVMEAISMGVPVIGCDKRGTRELIKHEINGFITSRCIDGLLKSMKALLAKPEIKQSTTRWAKEKRDDFSRINFFHTILCEIEKHQKHY
jgi:glycosyltransferase involved in cell wall biosynthesis